MATRKERTVKVLVLAAFMAAGLAVPVRAHERAVSYTEGISRKLGRGVSNVITCPLELIRTPTLVGRKDGIFAQLTVGIVQGAWKTLARGLTGAYEVLTFYAEIPKDYGPLITPEFVWKAGNWAEDEDK